MVDLIAPGNNQTTEVNKTYGESAYVVATPVIVDGEVIGAVALSSPGGLVDVLVRAERFSHHQIELEPLSVRERMTDLLSRVSEATEHVPFVSLFKRSEGRLGVIVTFLAMMELVKERLIDVVQNEPFAPIYLRPVTE